MMRMRMQRLRSAVKEEKRKTCITGKMGKKRLASSSLQKTGTITRGWGIFCGRKEGGGEIGEIKTRGAEYGRKRQRKEHQIDNSLQSCL